MHLQTKSPFLHDGRLYITDDDNGVKDMVFLEVLNFQPTMGWMYVQESSIDLFVDARYFDGVSKKLDQTRIVSPYGEFEVLVHLVEARQQRVREILTYLNTKKHIETLHIPTSLVVGQVHELFTALRETSLSHISLKFGTTTAGQHTHVIQLLQNVGETICLADTIGVYVTDHTSGMRDDHFLYYLGVDPAFACMTIEGSHIHLVLPESLKHIVYDTRSISHRLGLEEVVLELSYVTQKDQALRTLLGNISQKTLCLSPLMTLEQLLLLLTHSGDNLLVIGRSDFDEKRLIKHTDEQQEHTQAIQTIETVFEVIEYMNQKEMLVGKTEKDLVFLIRALIQKLGGIGEAFPSIVSVGKNSAVPHHIPLQTASGDDVLVPGPVLFDIGAVSKGGRCSDFTRVLFIGPKTGQLYQDFCLVEELVYDIHLFAVELAREGLTVGELDKTTREFALQKAQEKKDTWEGLFSRLGYEKTGSFETHMKHILYSHGLGHGVGIRIHEYPYFSKHPDMQLKKYMYITIEPGIYIPGYFGIRLENLYFVNANGTLTTDNALPLRFTQRQKMPPSKERDKELEELLNLNLIY